MPGSEFTKPLEQRRIQRVIGPLERFLHVEAASGGILLLATLVAICFANSPWAEPYLAIWKTKIGFSFADFEMKHSLKHWINDGLMVIFFFLIGLEVKRELVLGELKDLRRAVLPIVGAIGGMVVPACIYLVMQGDGPASRGWGIPMATDIAFVVGCLAVLGRKVPPGLRILVLSIAIADDIGAILVIAIGYTETIHVVPLVLGVNALLLVNLLSRFGLRSFGVYTILGMLAWMAFHESGIHATIAGVILGIMTPAVHFFDRSLAAKFLDRVSDVLHGGEWDTKAHRAASVRRVQQVTRETVSPLEYLEATLHPWVSFAIVPMFALANAGVAISMDDLGAPVSLAVIAGLVFGKPLGIVGACGLAVALRIAKMPAGVNFRMLIGAGFLAGIGFTMALFIDELALMGDARGQAKVGVIAASAVAAVIGMSILATIPTPNRTDEANEEDDGAVGEGDHDAADETGELPQE